MKFIVAEAQPTHKREKDHDGTLDELQPALRGSTGQSTGAQTLVPTGNVPEQMLSCPPDSS